MSEMSTIEAESGIPIPARGLGRGSGAGGRGRLYPWSEMKVGDSFAVPEAKLNSIKVLIHRQHKLTKRRFAWRKIAGAQIRVWRQK